EQTVEAGRASQRDDAIESHQRPEVGPVITRELAAIRSALGRNARELAVLINDGKDRRMARAAGDLGAAIEGMEGATQKILASAEAIDDRARALASALRNDYHHGLAQDVQDHVVRIYEACNFQDLAGQRIGKVIAILMMIEDRLVAMIARHSGSSEQPVGYGEMSSETLVNGPRLDGESGHASQRDID
ncbi:MAG TPA: protein phosphatase CheZ, partial [Pseudolabrys sp.]|nr:protein phosphatase CheZ [Pseudolabrys sp.]